MTNDPATIPLGVIKARGRRIGKRCEAKRAFDSEREALLYAREKIGKIKRDGKAQALKIYPCKVCGKLHLTGMLANFARTLRGRVAEVSYHGEKRELTDINDQEWFAEWVASKLSAAQDPTLEAILLSEKLRIFDGLLTPEFLMTLTPPRFMRHWENPAAVPYGFQIAMDDAAASDGEQA